MFSRAISAALVALPIFALASPAPNNAPAGSCSVGEMHCCEQTHTLGQSAQGGSLLGIPLDLGVILGLNCSPLSILGAGNSGCSAQPVCCNGNSAFLDVLGCTSVKVL